MKSDETPLHFLERILHYSEIYHTTLFSILMVQDSTIGFLAEHEEHNHKMIDFYITNRPLIQKELDMTSKNIENIKKEIELEIAYPTENKLVLKLKKLFGHL